MVCPSGSAVRSDWYAPLQRTRGPLRIWLQLESVGKCDTPGRWRGFTCWVKGKSVTVTKAHWGANRCYLIPFTWRFNTDTEDERVTPSPFVWSRAVGTGKRVLNVFLCFSYFLLSTVKKFRIRPEWWKHSTLKRKSPWNKNKAVENKDYFLPTFN